MAKQSGKRDSLSLSELSAFCAQIAMILKSGISVGEGIAIMYEDIQQAQGREILEFLHQRMDAGDTLCRALEQSGKFPKYLVDMTEIGEATGRLDEVMDSLSTYYEREEAIAKSIRNAITYPVIMVVMMVIVILVLVMNVMPMFNEVFVQLGAEMNAFSTGVLNFGQWVGRYAYILIAAAVAVLVFFLVLRATSFGRGVINKWKASFFATKKLNAKIASGRFASAMSLMMASGLDTDQSMDMVYKLVDNDFLKLKIVSCKSYIAKGANFSEALVQSGIFTGIYARMVNVAFRTGSVDGVMKKLSQRYEEEVDNDIGGIIAVLEPTLVAVLSVVVGMILLSVMLPLMGIMSTIG